jgi:vesicle transport through interaction with t-SNAREs protein 1
MLTKVRCYRETIARIQKDVRQKELQLTKTKLYQGSGDSYHQQEQDQDGLLRQQVVRGTAVLERTSQSLQRSQQVANETEEVGEAIISDLGVQRESLERARTMLHETDAELSRSKRILKRISRGTIYNKVLLY